MCLVLLLGPEIILFARKLFEFDKQVDEWFYNTQPILLLFFELLIMLLQTKRNGMGRVKSMDIPC